MESAIFAHLSGVPKHMEDRPNFYSVWTFVVKCDDALRCQTLSGNRNRKALSTSEKCHASGLLKN